MHRTLMPGKCTLVPSTHPLWGDQGPRGTAARPAACRTLTVCRRAFSPSSSDSLSLSSMSESLSSAFFACSPCSADTTSQMGFASQMGSARELKTQSVSAACFDPAMRD
jgi:hypothetical protein